MIKKTAAKQKAAQQSVNLTDGTTAFGRVRHFLHLQPFSLDCPSRTGWLDGIAVPAPAQVTPSVEWLASDKIKLSYESRNIAESKMSKLFQMPKPVTILGRSSSITNAFVNGIIPCIEPTDEEVHKALEILEQNENDLRCSYCGDVSTEWDHLNPLIDKKKPTGYISEIANLVPACGKCNQSKGNKDWQTWINSDAKLSPRTRGIQDVAKRIELIKKFQSCFVPHKVDFSELVGNELWEKHWANHEKLSQLMVEIQKDSDLVKSKIQHNFVNKNSVVK